MFANLLSALRFPLALILIPLVWNEHWAWALALMMIAIATDVIDGYVARRFAEPTPMGGLLDHGSDAFLVVCGLGTFAAQTKIPLLLPILVALAFTQYLLDSGGVRKTGLRGSQLGRMNGLLYIGFLVALIALNLFQAYDLAAPIVLGVAWALVGLTLLSMIDRARHWFQAERSPNN